MTEFELKFEIPSAKLKGVAVAMLEGKATRQRLQASYFDTANGALAAHGIVVRLRKEGRRWVQTAKGPTADLLERLEHNAALPSQSAAAMPALDLSRHRETPVGKVIDKVLGFKSGGNYPRLHLLYKTDVQRITRHIACGASVVEVALDQGRVFTGGHSQPVCELEFELKQGTPLDAVALARQWCACYGLWMSTIAKSMKGQRLCSANAVSAATSATSHKFLPKFSQHASGEEMITAIVRSCLSQILPNMSELAGGSNHPDHIHQLRVGIRRLRTAIRELGGLTDTPEPMWEAVLMQVFRALGDHRDHSYLMLVLQPQLLTAGGPDIRLSDANSHIPDPGETVRSEHFQDALIGLVGFVHRKVLKTANTSDALKKTISLRLGKLHKLALRDGKKFLALAEARQHAVRKRLKRLRYLVEFAAPLFAVRKVNHMTTELKPVLDALGLHNDELMALHAWCAVVEDDVNAWFGIGWLSARRQPNANRCLKEIKAFSQIKPFWYR